MKHAAGFLDCAKVVVDEDGAKVAGDKDGVIYTF